MVVFVRYYTLIYHIPPWYACYVPNTSPSHLQMFFSHYSRNCHPWGLNPHVLSVSNSFPAFLVGLESPQLFIESQFSLVNHAKPNIWYLNSTFLWFKPTVLLLNFPSSRPLALILRPPELREAAWSWDELRLVMETMVHLLRWFTEKKTLCFSVAMSNYQGHIVQFIMTKYGFAWRFWGTPILDGYSTSFAHGDIPHFPTHPYSHLKIWDMMAIKKVDMILIWANDLIYVERATIGDTMFCPALLHELKQYFSNLCLEIEPEPLIPWHLQDVFFLLSLMIEVFSCFTNGNPQLCWSSVVWPHYFQTSSYLSYSLDPEEVVLGGPASAYNICTTHKSLQVQWVWVRI